MIIANPIYDPIFKLLMENKRIATFFIETLIGEKIETIAMMPHEYVYEKQAKIDKLKEEQKLEVVEEQVFKILRYDFVATIRNANGEHKKIIIEIQKTSKPTDLMRFRSYLGKQYQTQDVIEVATGNVEEALPIISIYLLGFTVSKTKSPAIKVNRTYIDLIEQKEIKEKSTFIEALTHDGFFVQIPHIAGKPRTALEKLLSIFEQTNFIDQQETTKKYQYSDKTIEELEEMLNLLEYAAADPQTKREMEEAWWAEQDEKEYERVRQELIQKNQELTKKDQELTKQSQELTKKDQELTKQSQEIEELHRQIKELQTGKKP